MKYLELNLTALLVICLIATLAISTGCTEAGAGNAPLAANAMSSSVASETPSFVLPADLNVEESSILTASVEFGSNEEKDLGDFALKVHGNNLDVMTADGKKAASFHLDGGKMVPDKTQPMGNQVKSVYSGPAGDNYSQFRVYPASHKTGDGMKPYFEIDHNSGAIGLTPGKNVTIKSRGSSRGKRNTNTGSAGGGCGTGGDTGGGG